jgi:hypothetical protein
MKLIAALLGTHLRTASYLAGTGHPRAKFLEVVDLASMNPVDQGPAELGAIDG